MRPPPTHRGTLTMSILFAIALTAVVARATTDPIIHLSFEGDLANTANPDLVATAGSPGSFDRGVAGSSLDLTGAAVNRYPVDLGEVESLKGDGDLSVEVWVQMDPGTRDDNRIISCMDGFSGWRGTTDETRGWAIRSLANGSWEWQILGPAHHQEEGPKKKAATTVGMMYRGIDRDNPSYSYQATPERQPLDDGRWHQLAFTLDRQEEEARLYYDGRNVAIYDTGWLGSIADSSHTVVGGILARWHAERESFTGRIDEVRMWDRVVDGNQIKASYETISGTQVVEPTLGDDDLKVMTFNIWHGGKSHGESVGVQRTIDVIRETGADIIAMQETYGAGAIIADSLDYYFYLRSSMSADDNTNHSIMSRFPITAIDRVFKPFMSGGARIAINPDQEIAFYTVWNNYQSTRPRRPWRAPEVTAQQLVDGEKIAGDSWEYPPLPRYEQTKEILRQIAPVLAAADKVPVFVSGDWNSYSHLDWTEATADRHGGLAVEWPVSKELEDQGLIDAYRELHKRVRSEEGRRIDRIYYKGDGFRAIDAHMYRWHPVKWPSDHPAVIVTFRQTGE